MGQTEMVRGMFGSVLPGSQMTDTGQPLIFEGSCSMLLLLLWDCLNDFFCF